MKLFYECKSEKKSLGKGGGDTYIKTTLTRKSKLRYTISFMSDGHLEIKNCDNRVIYSTKYKGEQ